MGCSLWGHKELDTAEPLRTHTHVLSSRVQGAGILLMTVWLMSSVCCAVLSLRNPLQVLHCNKGLCWKEREKKKNSSSLILRIRMAVEGARWASSAEYHWEMETFVGQEGSIEVRTQ